MSATEAPAHAPSVDAVQRRRGRRRTRRVLTRLHRWAALLAGVILLVVTLSGVALIFEPELDTVLHPSLYQSTRSAHPIAPEQAVAVVRRELPDFGPVDVVANRGVYEVYGRDYVRQAHIDPGSGRLLGVGNHDAGVMGFLKNLHMCALTCEEYPAHIGLLSTATPILGNDDLTVGGLLVVAVAILLVGLCLSGLVLWWPGARRVARGLRIRRGKGRYALHYDLHKVIGFAAIPFLLMWAITGAGFEVKQVEQAWYALVPGKRPPEYRAMQSRPQPDRTVDQR